MRRRFDAVLACNPLLTARTLAAVYAENAPKVLAGHELLLGLATKVRFSGVTLCMHDLTGVRYVALLRLVRPFDRARASFG
jgi:hypothetical protein